MQPKICFLKWGYVINLHIGQIFDKIFDLTVKYQLVVTAALFYDYIFVYFGTHIIRFNVNEQMKLLQTLSVWNQTIIFL